MPTVAYAAGPRIFTSSSAVVGWMPTVASNGAFVYIPTMERWPASGSASAPVAVVIPIHDARAATIRCVESVLRHASDGCRIVLADDASTDPDLLRDLRLRAAGEARVELQRSDCNLGFVATCNRAIRSAPQCDVLLLNSDTVVTRGFLDRLRDCAYDTPDTGIVCPLSNNATILSVPKFCEENPIPAGHTIDSFADLIARASPKLRPDIVTAVGFCMYVRRIVFDRIGVFDEVRFGRGYGEENDLCERALAAGFRIRLADDAFVFHEGGASFGPETAALKQANAATMDRLHPTYLERVVEFVRSNPLAPIHAAIEQALARLEPTRP
jgi:O-antigen biosynthesis protein